MVVEKEAELAEINPLAILTDGSIIALDAKVIIDDNSLFRHEDLKMYLYLSELEKQASKNGFSFVELDGDIAIIGNGAGLVMSTLIWFLMLMVKQDRFWILEERQQVKQFTKLFK